jgi:uncharacterized membrane protein
MFYASLKVIHVLSVVVWVGGMFFTLFFLRPAAAALELPERVRLMHEVLRKFFKAVLVLSLLALLTGVAMLLMHDTGPSPTAARMPWSWTAMTVIGTAMVAIFGHIRFVLFRRLSDALALQAWTSGGAALASIRSWVRANLALGLAILIVVVGAG